MLVVVIAVCRVPVTVVVVVHVVLVGDLRVPAVRAMHVLVAWVRQVRQRMLVIVIVMLCVGMAIVHVVGVTGALHAGVPAAGSVVMLMLGMHLVFAGCHGSSLLC
jgi:hypothetical protein